MTAHWLALVVAILCLLVAIPPAHAECAWVLWARWAGEEPYVDRAFRSPEACYAAIAEELTAVRRRGDGATIRERGPDYAQYLDQGQKVSILKCLPDTVDPRTPKR